jgi:hypothetical protein
MKKTLEQIQKENRKFILEAIHNCNFYPLIEDKESGAYPEYKLWNLFGFDWDLTSETLEQQSEETQRQINKIFIGE